MYLPPMYGGWQPRSVPLEKQWACFSNGFSKETGVRQVAVFSTSRAALDLRQFSARSAERGSATQTSWRSRTTPAIEHLPWGDACPSPTVGAAFKRVVIQVASGSGCPQSRTFGLTSPSKMWRPSARPSSSGRRRVAPPGRHLRPNSSLQDQRRMSWAR
jgi:hypothetical protein